MSEKINIPIPKKHLASLQLMEGLARALDCLRTNEKKAGNAPGYLLATELIRGLVAEARVEWSGIALRSVSAAGHDISAIPHIYTTQVDGKISFQIDAEPNLFDEGEKA